MNFSLEEKKISAFLKPYFQSEKDYQKKKNSKLSSL
jgi:hypothetical protein